MKKNGLLKALHSLFVWDEEGSLVIENDVEDIHSQIERRCHLFLAQPGKKFIQDDQETTRCWLISSVYQEEIDKLSVLIRSLLTGCIMSEQYKEVLIPGYTHMQPAWFHHWLWFGAYAECLVDDVLFYRERRALNNQNPLGTAAGYGLHFRLTENLHQNFWNLMTFSIIQLTQA